MAIMSAHYWFTLEELIKHFPELWNELNTIVPLGWDKLHEKELQHPNASASKRNQSLLEVGPNIPTMSGFSMVDYQLL